MLTHHELSDGDFIAISAFEFTVCEDGGEKISLNAIALDPALSEIPDFVANRGEVMSKAEIVLLVRKLRECGFFVICNHPRKSLASCGSGSALEGVDAIEIINYSSLCEGYNEYNEALYEDVLKSGTLPFCVASDGNKNLIPFGHRACDSCGAYIMVQAEELSYAAIADALRCGRFYSTEGPEIYNMWYRSEVLYIRCSPADKIIFESGTRRSVYFAENGLQLDGQGIYFWVMPEHGYARVTVIDAHGKKAFSNAIASNDLFYTYEKLEEGTL